MQVIPVCGQFSVSKKECRAYGCTFDVPAVIYAHKEIESIEADGEYEIVSLGKNGGSRIEIRTNIGNHKVTIKLK